MKNLKFIALITISTFVMLAALSSCSNRRDGYFKHELTYSTNKFVGFLNTFCCVRHILMRQIAFKSHKNGRCQSATTFRHVKDTPKRYF